MGFLGAMCFSTVGSSMTIYYNQYLGARITGILLIVSSIMVFIVGLWSGHLADKLGRRPIMLISTLITTLGGAVATFSNSPLFFDPWLTYIGFLILNFGYGFFNTASSAMIVDLTDSDNRRVVYSLQYWVINVAVLIGSALSGWFFHDYLFELLLAVTLEELLSFILVLTVIPESFNPANSLIKQESIFKAYHTVSKDHAFMIYCFASIFIAMIFSQVDFYLPVHLSDSFQITNFSGLDFLGWHLGTFTIYGQRMLSIMLIINTAIIVLGMGFVNKLTKNWKRSTGVSLGVSIQGLGFILAFLGTSFQWEFVAAVIFTLGEMINVPFSQALRADLMESGRIGTYSGVFSVTQPIASILCGLMVSGSALYGNLGSAILMVFVVILGVGPTLLAIRMHERPQSIQY